MSVQSVLFNSNLWTQEQARKYLSRHHFVDNGVDETENFFRYRQINPDPTKRYFTKTLKHGVEYVIMY
jgi:hypothetical protein